MEVLFTPADSHTTYARFPVATEQPQTNSSSGKLLTTDYEEALFQQTPNSHSDVATPATEEEPEETVQKDENHFNATQDTLALVTPVEFNSLNQFSLDHIYKSATNHHPLMDSSVHYTTPVTSSKSAPVAAPTPNAQPMAGDHTPLQDPYPQVPALSAHLFIPQESHYSYPHAQIPSRSENIGYVTQEHRLPQVPYSTQPRTTAPLIPQLDQSQMLNFPVNNSLYSTRQASHMSPQQQPQDLFYHSLNQPLPHVNTPSGLPMHGMPMPSFPFPPPNQRSQSYTDPTFPRNSTPHRSRMKSEITDPMKPTYTERAQQATHKPEQFTMEDVDILRSLLSNGEKVKWRYISSRLSATTGRRATSTTCIKKTRELFKLPSERALGTLGTSLPYVLHNSWDKIVEGDDAR